ncbi:MAG: DegT/DnrJ/EryC1/StrS family aminotransferase [Planctomycetes bacterium]|nr:DegT/DnrJ/EryC1/StrS family aminotransferase [Planctomycetota bacterium]
MAVEFYRHALREEDVEAVARVLRGTFLTTGPVCREVEASLAAYLGVPHVLTMTSCTAALEVALRAFGIGPGDEVIVPAFTFVATATAVLHVGATPVLADVDRETGCLGVAGVVRARTPRTRCVIPVHLYGQMADVEAIREVLADPRVRILEDAAHCVEGTLRGVRPGQATDGAAFSFYATKNLTCGEGGALALRDPELAERARRLRQHGMTASAAERYQGTKGYRHWDVVDLGVKANLPDVLAALLVGQIPRLDAQRVRREALARRYEEAVDALPGWDRPWVRPEATSAYHLQTAWAPAHRRDDALAGFAARDVGVAVNWKALPQLTFVRQRLRADPADFPVACEMGARTLSLPLWPDMTDAMQDEAVAALRAVARDLARG